MIGRGSHNKAQLHTVNKKIRPLTRRTPGAQGYTIAEVMIFLAVTAGIFIMISASFAGTQRRAEFNTAARDMESRIQDIANDIATGFYSTTENFSCTLVAGAPNITAGPQGQGTNNECILVGRAIHFVNTAFPQGDSFTAYSVAGARQANVAFVGWRDVENYIEAQPRAITNNMETIQVPIGLRITSMYIDGGGRINGVGFYTTFGALGGTPSALNVNVVPLSGADGGALAASIRSNGTYAPANLNPVQGIVLCMDGDGVDQHAVLRIGGRNSKLTTDTEIRDGTCAASGLPA